MENKMKKPIYVAFASQKGGVGKSSIITLLASSLSYDADKKVKLLLVDCDEKQLSLIYLRHREKQAIAKNDALASMMYKKMSELNKYELIAAPTNNCIEVANNFIKEKGLDVELVLFDMPGRLPLDEGELKQLLHMDYIFSPIEADRQSLASSLSYAGLINDQKMKREDSLLKHCYLFWNKVKKNAQTKAIMCYGNEVAKRYKMLCMENYLEDSSIYSREMVTDVGGICRSTYLPPEKEQCRRLNLSAFVREISEIINLTYLNAYDQNSEHTKG